MNRLQSVDGALENRNVRRFTKPTDGNGKGTEAAQQFRQFIPLHYEKNYAYPLLVWLHGPTGSEFEINQVMPHISMRNYVGICPRGVVEHEAKHANGDATYTWDQSPQNVEWAIEDVLSCVEYAQTRFNIAPNRIFLAGNDAGGTMALRIALAQPGYFAGVASVCGSMPDTDRPLAAIEEARSMPVLLMQGQDSEQYSTDHLCSDLRLLHAAGVSATVRQYPCGQEVTTKMLSDLNAWMMERVAGVPSDSFIYDDPTHLRAQDVN